MEMTTSGKPMDFKGIIDFFHKAVLLKRPRIIIIEKTFIFAILLVILVISSFSTLSCISNKTPKSKKVIRKIVEASAENRAKACDKAKKKGLQEFHENHANLKLDEYEVTDCKKIRKSPNGHAHVEMTIDFYIGGRIGPCEYPIWPPVQYEKKVPGRNLNCSVLPPGQNSKRGRIFEVKHNGKRIILYEESHALLIGISKYKHWDDLNSIPEEMKCLKSTLERKGFIVQSHENLSSAFLKEKIEEFISRNGLKKNNRLLIFFSGHGCTRRKGTRGYIVPSDAPCPEDNKSEFVNKAIEMEQILTWAKKIESKHALFVFDSCFSGTIFQTRGSPPPTPPYVTYLTGKPVRQFITAGDEKERVPGKSVFLQCFIKGIEGDADSARDKDFYITGTELGIYLQKEVPAYKAGHTPQFGKLRDPEFDRGDFVFILNGPPPSSPPIILPNNDIIVDKKEKMFEGIVDIFSWDEVNGENLTLNGDIYPIGNIKSICFALEEENAMIKINTIDNNSHEHEVDAEIFNNRIVQLKGKSAKEFSVSEIRGIIFRKK